MIKNHILIVEDEAIVASDIQHSLQKLGFSVIGIESSGENALQFLEKNHPDLILMDIMLQDKLTGLDTAEIILKKFNIPIIFLTAYVDDVTLTRAKMCEPFGYIIKPFKEIELQTAIEMALYKFKKEDDLIKERNLLYSIMDQSKIINDILFIKSENKIVKISLSDIYFIESNQAEVSIFTKDITYNLQISFHEMEVKLNTNFINISDQYLINQQKIQRIDFPTIYLKDIFKVLLITKEEEVLINHLFNL
ncbi:MAG: response regulator [Crocinitomicaceae bacterium]|nr:response regulator [Crocinitomicaceae bacterium]